MKKPILIYIMMVLSISCFAQQGKWKKAQRINTIESYQEFITTYPESEYLNAARIKMETLLALQDWNLAVASNKKEDYEDFLKVHADSPYANEAKSKIEILVWQETVASNRYDAYCEYLEHYPNSPRAKEVQKKLGSLQSEKARDTFKILKVLLSDEKQTFLTGYTIGGNGSKPIYEVGTPLKGEIFLLVDWDLGDFKVYGDKLSIPQSELKLLEPGEEPQVGYVRALTASSSDKPIWQSGGGYTITYPIGEKPSGTRLFVIKTENKNSLNIQFKDRVYPLVIPVE